MYIEENGQSIVKQRGRRFKNVLMRYALVQIVSSKLLPNEILIG